MTAPIQIFEDRDFRSAGRESQRQRLTDNDPEGFGSMSSVHQDAIIEEGMANTEPDADYLAALERGFYQSIASAAHLGANLSSFIPGLDEVEDNLRGFAESASEEAEAPEDQTFGEMMAGIAGSLPVGLGIAASMVYGAGGTMAALGIGAARTLAPIVGFAALGALGASDQGPEEAAKAAMMEGAFGALFPGTQHLTRYARAAILGGASYSLMPEEVDFQERVGHGLTMALMAGIPRARDPIALMKKMGAKPPHREVDVDLSQKAKKELAMIGEMETAAHARDQARERAEQTRVPEPPLRSETEGKGDPSVESARGRFQDPRAPKETNSLVIEEKDLALDEHGNRKYSGPASEHPGKTHQRQAAVEYSTNVPLTIVRHNDIFIKMAKLLGFPIRRGRMYQDSKGKLGVAYPIQAQGGPRANEWNSASGYSKIKYFSEVGTGTHEFGHQLSSMARIQEYPGMWNSPEARALYAKNPKISDLPIELQELHHISYAAGKPEEGLAELVRHWLANKGYAQEHAPNATALFEKAAQDVLTKKQWKGLLQLQEQVHKWFDQGSAATAIAKIGGPEATEDMLHSKAARAREQVFDDSMGGLELVRMLGIEMPDSFYEAVRRYRGVGSLYEGMRKFGTLKEVPDPKNKGKFKFEFEGPGWGKIMKEIAPKDFEDFWYYVTGRAAKELIGQHELPGGKIIESTKKQRETKDTREKLFDENEINSMLAKKKPGFEETYEKLKDFRSRTADFMEQTGLINPQQRASWMRQEFVFSLWRDLQLGKKGLGRTSDKLASDVGIYRQHGTTRNLRDPFISFVEGVNRQIAAGLKNRALLELADISQAKWEVQGRHYGPNERGVEGAGAFLHKIDADANVVKAGIESLRKSFKNEFQTTFGMDATEAERMVEFMDLMQDHGVVQVPIFMGQQKPFGSNIMTVMRNGKPEYYEVQDPMLQRTIENMSRPAQSELMQQWGKLKTLKQSFIVVEPSFMVANFIRDVAMASIMTRTGNQHLTAALNGLRHIWKQDKTYQDFIANGGGGSTMRDNLHITKARLSRHTGGPLNPKNMMVTFSDVTRSMETIGRALENASRVGEYARGRRKGMTSTHAAFLAREVSTDFSMRGGNRGALGFANTTIPFFSAMLAGVDRGYRATFRDPTGKAKTALKMGMVGTGSAVLYGMNKQLGATFGHLQDEDGRQMVDFNNLPQWTKTAYWHWYIPTEFSTETGNPTSFMHLHMPKLWEVGAIATWAELAVESMQQGDDDDRSLAKDFLQVAAGNFNINLIEEGFMLPLPVGVDLALEQTSNKILFTGSPIETAGMENLQPWQRARAGQSQTMKKWGELFKGDLGDYVPSVIKSPARAEALLRGFTSNWGNMALQVVDSAVFPGGPSLGLDDYPVLRRVYSEAGKYDKNVKGFYDNLRTFNQAYGTVRHMAKQGDIEALSDMMLDPDQVEMVGLSPGFDRINRTIQLMNREISLIRDGAVMAYSTGREKAAAINRVQAQRNDLMKQMNKLANHYRNK